MWELVLSDNYFQVTKYNKQKPPARFVIIHFKSEKYIQVLLILYRTWAWAKPLQNIKEKLISLFKIEIFS